eukprot:10711457-Ditylum_brightwellii.AAC.1
MIVDPLDDLTLDFYCDTNATGLWGHEYYQDPDCVKSQTCFVLTLVSTPISWVSKLQMEIAYSTMEAEYIILTHSMRHLLPTCWLLE